MPKPRNSAKLQRAIIAIQKGDDKTADKLLDAIPAPKPIRKRKYTITAYSDSIQIRDYDKETADYFICTVPKSMRHPTGMIRFFKDTRSGCRYFDTWEEAHEALKDQVRRRLSLLQKEVRYAQVEITRVDAMTKPNYRPSGS